MAKNQNMQKELTDKQGSSITEVPGTALEIFKANFPWIIVLVVFFVMAVSVYVLYTNQK
ncbi:MAG: hypothetical protein WC955_09800 [Elusimicrobiota bacterium]